MRRCITHFRKNQVKSLLLFTVITLTIFVGVSPLSLSNDSVSKPYDIQSASTLDIPWSGSGDPQSARAYIQKSDSASSQTDDFGISVPTSPAAIHSASMNFTILSTFETTHEFEQDSPLEYPQYNKSSRQSSHWSTVEALSPDTLSIEIGSEKTGSGGFTALVDGNEANALILENTTVSPADNEIVIIYTANFSNVVNYNKLKTVGFRIDVLRSISKDVGAQISLFNYQTTTWDVLYIKNWDNAQVWDQIVLANTRISYLNTDNQVQIRIALEDQDAFYVTYRELKVEAFIAAQAPISTLNHAALEFDIMGDVEVSGFYAWIRTLTPVLPGAELTIELYRANTTARRNIVTSPTRISMKPGTLIETNTISNFATDDYVFIPFKSDYSEINLNVSNYFVVLSANKSNVYAITSLPYSENDGKIYNNDPNLKIDHLFLVTDNGGVTWEKLMTSEGQVDAAPFAINVTRPYIPEEVNMSVDIQAIASYAITSGIYTNTSGYRWGLGKWAHVFNTPIQDSSNIITIPIGFNASVISSIDFNVSYSSVVYSIEDTTTNYHVELDENPSWEVNYTLNKAQFTGWNYINSSFIIPTDWVLEEFVDTNYELILEYEYNVKDDYLEYWIEDLTDGVYSFNATSPNYVFEMNSYLQYEDKYWDTHGFMQGDNISLSLGILNFTDMISPIYSGNSSIEVYDPTNTLLPSLTLNDITPDDTEAVLFGSENILLSYYEFDHENLLNTTGATQQGEYSLVYKWKEGNEVGYKLLPIFIMDYDVNITQIGEDLQKRVDVVLSSIDRYLTTAPTFNVSVFAIDDITGLPSDGTYHIDQPIGHVYTEYGFNVNVSNILVNETLLNPGETVKLNLTFESLNRFWDNDVTVDAQFIQSINYDWIVMEQSTSFALGIVGSGTENTTIELQFTVPTDYKGINGPIRLNPFVLKIDVNINGVDLKPLYHDSLFPFVEKTESEFEGRVYAESLVHYRPGPIGKIFSAEIERVEELVHSTATYLLQISDSYYVTSSVSEYDDFISKPIATLNDINAVGLIWGDEFQLQGNLIDEFGAVLSGQTVDVQVFNGSDWIVYNQTTSTPLVSDSQGFFNGTYDTIFIPKSVILHLNLTWAGNSTVYGTSELFDLSMITYENTLQVTIIGVDQIILKEKQENTILFKITNLGNSTLKDFTINFDFVGKLSDRRGDLQYSAGKQLEPNEVIYIEYYITIPGSFQGDTGVVTVDIMCENHDSHEIVTYETSFELTVLTSSFLDNLDGFFKAFFFIGVIALILGAVYYSVKIYRKLQKVPTQKKEEKPRRGRYVEVAKLQKNQEQVNKIEEVVQEEKETADLDDLLKEEGLED